MIARKYKCSDRIDYRRAVSNVEEVTGEYKMHGKVMKCKRYRYHLECGHVITRFVHSAGTNPLSRKLILCEYCEGGE